MVEAMHGHIGIQVQSLDLGWPLAAASLEDDKAAGPACVAGHGTKVLAADSDAHQCLLGRGWIEQAATRAQRAQCRARSL
jgi:hypothetical protein